VFHIGLTRDFFKPDGSFGFGDIGLDLLDRAAGITYEFLAEDARELTPPMIAPYDGLLLLGARVTPRTLTNCGRLAIIARFGVGYDTVDVSACTANDVLLTITPDGVRRPVASSALALMLALAHRLPQKDRLTRAGRWNEKLEYHGTSLGGRTLGLIGLGNIARDLLKLVQPFEMQTVAADPFATTEQAASAGATLVELEELLRTADFVVICCALTAQTEKLLNAARLALMKPSAFLINIARGPIVDQAALTSALQGKRLAGAGLDVFEKEPIDRDDPLLTLENVIVAPHCLAWTDELLRGVGSAAIQSLLDVAAGRVPKHVVNRDAIERPGVQAKLARFCPPP
jgi:D-3-phosphoglycerate dehydrogenase